MTFVTAFSLSGSLYLKQFFKLIFKMKVLSLLRTKWVMQKRSISYVRVGMFAWHNIWAGSTSDALLRVLSVTNCKSTQLLLPLFPVRSPRAFALAISSAWNVFPSARSHYSRLLECSFQSYLLWESLREAWSHFLSQSLFCLLLCTVSHVSLRKATGLNYPGGSRFMVFFLN